MSLGLFPADDIEPLFLVLHVHHHGVCSPGSRDRVRCLSIGFNTDFFLGRMVFGCVSVDKRNSALANKEKER